MPIRHLRLAGEKSKDAEHTDKMQATQKIFVHNSVGLIVLGLVLISLVKQAPLSLCDVIKGTGILVLKY